jgi:hypothetical protein
MARKDGKKDVVRWGGDEEKMQIGGLARKMKSRGKTRSGRTGEEMWIEIELILSD